MSIGRCAQAFKLISSGPFTLVWAQKCFMGLICRGNGCLWIRSRRLRYTRHKSVTEVCRTDLESPKCSSCPSVSNPTESLKQCLNQPMSPRGAGSPAQQSHNVHFSRKDLPRPHRALNCLVAVVSSLGSTDAQGSVDLFWRLCRGDEEKLIFSRLMFVMQVSTPPPKAFLEIHR